MELFDYCVIGFIPVSVVLILIQFIMSDWNFDFMWKEEE